MDFQFRSIFRCSLTLVIVELAVLLGQSSVGRSVIGIWSTLLEVIKLILSDLEMRLVNVPAYLFGTKRHGVSTDVANHIALENGSDVEEL